MALVPFLNKVPATVPGNDLERDRGDVQDESDTAGKMSFLDHLDELRRRIVYAVLSIAVGFIVAFLFITRSSTSSCDRCRAAAGGRHADFHGSLRSVHPLHQDRAHRRADPGVAGVMTQVWLFIAPGLYVTEKKWAIPFVLMSSFFFVAGAAFSHYVVFPLTWRFFVSFTTDILTFMPRIQPAFSLYMRLLLAFGVVFQMPTVVLFLARMGLVTARFMIQKFKYALLAIVVIAAVATPGGDVVPQIAMAIPMIFLYGLSICLAWMFGKKRTD